MTVLLAALAPVSVVAAAKPFNFSEDQPVDIQAEQLSHDDQTQTVTAIGDVELVQGGKILRADKLIYNLETDTVSAIGNVSLLDETGDVYFAEYIELSGNMKDGFIQGLLALLSDGSRFTAAEARREGGVRNVMSEASYTPCNVCEENPQPLWQIRADKVEHDEANKSVRYKNARLELFGVPLAFAPIFSHADPTVERKSGFLRPSFGWASDTGAFVQGGYYFGDIAPNIDATLQVRPTTQAGVLTQGEWRQRFESGRILLDVSGVVSDREEEHGEIDSDRRRGHIFAEGLFDINNKWRAGFGVQRVSDKEYLRLYDISNEDVLQSEAYAERFSGRDYTRISALNFQDVRLGDRPDQPDILPMAEHRMLGEPNALFGGRWSAGAAALGLLRDEGGQDVQRGSLDIGWERRDIAPIGLVTRTAVSARGDVYALQDRTAAVVNPGLASDSTGLRGMATAGVTASYPMVRRLPGAQVLLEPVVGASISPQVDDDDSRIPNEDSIDIQLDSNNLFSDNRFPGVDRQEDGARVDYGLRVGLYADNGRFGRVFLGQSYRFDDDDIFPEGSGLEDNSSDLVGQVNVSLSRYLNADYRFQLDNQELNIRRHELQAGGGNDHFNLSLGYFYLDRIVGTGFDESREQIRVNGAYRFTENWTVDAYSLTDLGEEPGLRKAALGLTYADECFLFGLQGSRNLTRDASGDGGTTIMMRIGLRNIGEFATPKIQLGEEEQE